MSEKPTVYPELTEQGKEEAQKIMDSFKPKIKALFEEIMGNLYTDVSYHVDSDHWTNYRNALMDGLRGYKEVESQSEYNYKQIREAIYRNHKDEIIKDLNSDLVNEIEDLKNQIKNLETIYNRSY